MPKYINADELIITLGFAYEDIPPTLEELVELVRRSSLEDVAPVVHAHWKTVDETNPFLVHGECSHCGYEQWIRDDLRFCPNCGAKMDEMEEL